MSNDIHRYEEALRSRTESVKASDMDTASRSAILAFDRDCAIRGISNGRRAKYLWLLRELRPMIGKPFRQARKADIIRAVELLNSSPYAKSTQRDFRIALKRFYQFLSGTKQGYPQQVEWVTTGDAAERHMLPDQVLSPEEVQRIVAAAATPRDRAIIMALYESGCRVGEFLPLKVKDVSFDQYGAVLMVSGKTGGRRVRVIASAPALGAWLNLHPQKDNPEAFVWISEATNCRNRLLGYAGFCNLLKELARRAKVLKAVNPHAFRHARATHLANKLTEAQMKELFGWTQSSNMASVYVHLSGRDVDNALLEIAGLSAPSKPEDKFRVKVCPRCQEKNSPDVIYCSRCALPLDVRVARWEDNTMDELLKHPAVRRVLEKVILKSRNAA